MGGHQLPNRGATDDWITPEPIIKALGPFDLDPCACDPQPWRTARTMITAADDGLQAVWRGRVWLNPPYGKQTGIWLNRLADHGDGIALVFARTETEMFFAEAWRRATAMLFLQGRLWFHRPDGTRGSSNSGAPSVLLAYGKRSASKLANCGLAGAYCTGWKLNGVAQ